MLQWPFDVWLTIGMSRCRHALPSRRSRRAGLCLLGLVISLPMPTIADVDPWAGLPSALQPPGMVTETFREVLAQFYARSQYRPLWFDNTQPASNKVAALLDALAQATREGLDPADYTPTALRQACAIDPADPVACELRLTDSLLRYARDVGYGSLRAIDMDPHWHIPQADLPVAQLLADVASTTDLTALLQRLPPPHPAYRQLRTALAAYRQGMATTRWFPIPDGPTLRPGEWGDRVLALRERLGAEQLALLASADPAHFDAPLVAAVKAFQADHGLGEDGIVGTQTLTALNVSPETRIAQIRLNMERWRWLPRELGASYILVNLAGFELTLYQVGELPLRLRAINGRPDRTSPAFQSRINRLVVNPDWTVPRRLAVEDMLPQLKRDPQALLAKGIHVLRRQNGVLIEVDPAGVDWHSYHNNNFPFVLRQAPGPSNSLGRLKFMMPNPFDIFIHDTPAKALFSKSVRTLSSGCIRVDQPVLLASRLLGDDPERTAQSLRRQIERGETGSLPITSPVPVYLVYLTAWVDDAGNLQFRNDVYGRDSQMLDRFAFP